MRPPNENQNHEDAGRLPAALSDPTRRVDRLSAQKVRVDLVFGMPLAGVPFRPDRPQPELLHQPPDPPAANRNPLTQQRHLEPRRSSDSTRRLHASMLNARSLSASSVN
jgi:hypothetical protein